MNWTTREFSAAAWERIAPIRERIDRLPLLVELADGTLAGHRFVEYIVQDDFYLRGYSRALAQLAARAPHARARAFWAQSAGEAVAGEVMMHDALLNDPLLKDAPHAEAASPTTRGTSTSSRPTSPTSPTRSGWRRCCPATGSTRRWASTSRGGRPR